MNERIKELALHSKLRPALLLNYWGKIDALTDSEQEELEQLEKFAELIIMECLTICEELGDKGMDGHYCADEIQKRFGLGHMANVLAGAKVVTDDGGYSIGTKEGYEAFASNRMK
jgi:hypothetical protein